MGATEGTGVAMSDQEALAIEEITRPRNMRCKDRSGVPDGPPVLPGASSLLMHRMGMRAAEHRKTWLLTQAGEADSSGTSVFL